MEHWAEIRNKILQKPAMLLLRHELLAHDRSYDNACHHEKGGGNKERCTMTGNIRHETADHGSNRSARKYRGLQQTHSESGLFDRDRRGHENSCRTDRTGKKPLRSSKHQKLPWAGDKSHQQYHESATEHCAQQHWPSSVVVRQPSPYRRNEAHRYCGDRLNETVPVVEVIRAVHAQILQVKRDDRH